MRIPQFLAANVARPTDGVLPFVSEYLQLRPEHRPPAKESDGRSDRSDATARPLLPMLGSGGGQSLCSGDELLELAGAVVAAGKSTEFHARPEAAVGVALQRLLFARSSRISF